MKELLKHAIEASMMLGSGYLLTMLIVLSGILRAARRTSDDWEEYTRNTSL
ncbi:MAG TPA: hypothetical protein VFT66_16655 [Roseiflexaceae bacterium]|jgi:hypothetical protein|nr:hypothetical protein [Roseiflexaceae bacterium]